MPESEPGSAEKLGVLVGVVPKRLAAADERPLPESVDNGDHELIAMQAIEWQGAAGKAQFWEAGAAGRTEEGRPYELAGLMASAGEQLALAYAGAVEVALWQEVRQGLEPDPADEVSMRGMVESQCLFVMGTGHALANVAVRALALNQSSKAVLIEELGRRDSSPTFAPFSRHRIDWVPLNAPTCKALRVAARSCGA